MSDFQDKVQNEIKQIKKSLLKEELSSAIFALVFGSNVACLVIFPFTFISLLNVIAVWWVAGNFRSTVKRQFAYHQLIEHLTKMKEEKVWTHQDK